jgi:hypothetical protein
MTIKKFLREPLLHFLVLGAGLYFLYGIINSESADARNEIVIDAGRLSILSTSFERVWQRVPTDAELKGLIDSYVREEVMYREGIALSLDRNDAIVRRRVAQKMSFIADGLVPNTPTEAESQSWLAEHAGDYRISPSYSLRQIYINPQRHAGELDSVIASTRTALAAASGETVIGDSTMLPSSLMSAGQQDIVRTFGSEFADAILDVDVGSWQGPIRSSFGLHFVDISERIAARDPSLDEVRQAVERDFLNSRSLQISDAFYQSLLERYAVRYADTDQ